MIHQPRATFPIVGTGARLRESDSSDGSYQEFL
jgi:hypothetical protein